MVYTGLVSFLWAFGACQDRADDTVVRTELAAIFWTIGAVLRNTIVKGMTCTTDCARFRESRSEWYVTVWDTAYSLFFNRWDGMVVVDTVG